MTPFRAEGSRWIRSVSPPSAHVRAPVRSVSSRAQARSSPHRRRRGGRSARRPRPSASSESSRTWRTRPWTPARLEVDMEGHRSPPRRAATSEVMSCGPAVAAAVGIDRDDLERRTGRRSGKSIVEHHGRSRSRRSARRRGPRAGLEEPPRLRVGHPAPRPRRRPRAPRRSPRAQGILRVPVAMAATLAEGLSRATPRQACRKACVMGTASRSPRRWPMRTTTTGRRTATSQAASRVGVVRRGCR